MKKSISNVVKGVTPWSRTMPTKNTVLMRHSRELLISP